ncbi:NMT1-like family protein [uncultured archaeon]|nr:NMT1-like family protein [uncultured archaeon]
MMDEELVIGYLSTLYHTSFILRGSGLMEDTDLKASWKLFPNGPAMVDALEMGEIGLCFLGLPPAMIGIARGVKIKCVAGGHVEGTVLIGGSGYNPRRTAKDALTQFKGKTIGTPRKGSIHDVILRKLVADLRLEDEIKIENYDWADFILDAMMDGEVDGGCGTPPLAVLARRQLGAKIVLETSKTWPFNPSYGIIATERLISDCPSVLGNFLKVHEDACRLLREKPNEAARMVHKAMKIIEEDFAMEVFRISPKYCASLPSRYIDSAMAFLPVLREMGYISRDLRKEDVFDTKLIEKIHPESHHYSKDT